MENSRKWEKDQADAVIVGAGASGGVVAKELAAAGMKVVLLERGALIDPAKYRQHDELATRRTGSPLPDYAPSETRHPREFRFQGEKEFRKILPSGGSYGWMGGVVGGGQLTYAALMWRRPPIDFRMKSEYGPVAGTTLEDWPLSYEELEPFYDKAEKEIGVCGEGGINPFEGKRSSPFPLPPLNPSPGDELLQRAAHKLGYHPFMSPLGIVTRDYRGRGGCIHHPCCNGFVCEIGAKSSMVSAFLPELQKSENCRLIPLAVAAEITTNSRGKPDGVRYFDQRGRAVHQRARLIVLAASATETPRLLLNSKSRWFPRGMANPNDWVGRNLMGHTGPKAYAFFPEATSEGVGPGTGLALDDFHGKNPGLVGGGVLYSHCLTTPLNFAGIRPPGEPEWGRPHKKFQREQFNHYYRITSPAEDLPQFENRVEASPQVRDAWGIPVARITHSFHANDHALFDFLTGKMERLLREAGAREVFAGNSSRGGISLHQNGTCRMGNDPKTSVVNRYGQTHEVDSLFVVDGSLFVTSGGRNPALTIQALAYWSSDYLVQQWKGGAWHR